MTNAGAIPLSTNDADSTNAGHGFDEADGGNVMKNEEAAIPYIVGISAVLVFCYSSREFCSSCSKSIGSNSGVEN